MNDPFEDLNNPMTPPPPMGVMFVPVEPGIELHVTSPSFPDLHKVHLIPFDDPDMELMRAFVRKLLLIMFKEMIGPDPRIEDFK